MAMAGCVVNARSLERFLEDSRLATSSAMYQHWYSSRNMKPKHPLGALRKRRNKNLLSKAN